MHYPSGEQAMGCIKEGTKRGHEEYETASQHACGEGLSVPREEGYRLDRGEVEQTTFDAPEDNGRPPGLAGVGGWLIQNSL